MLFFKRCMLIVFPKESIRRTADIYRRPTNDCRRCLIVNQCIKRKQFLRDQCAELKRQGKLPT
jgi:hypothetical protein